MDGQAHHAEQTAIQRDIFEAELAAIAGVATPDEISLLVWAGVDYDYRRFEE